MSKLNTIKLSVLLISTIFIVPTLSFSAPTDDINICPPEVERYGERFVLGGDVSMVENVAISVDCATGDFMGKITTYLGDIVNEKTFYKVQSKLDKTSNELQFEFGDYLVKAKLSYFWVAEVNEIEGETEASQTSDTGGYLVALSAKPDSKNVVSLLGQKIWVMKGNTNGLQKIVVTNKKTGNTNAELVDFSFNTYALYNDDRGDKKLLTDETVANPKTFKIQTDVYELMKAWNWDIVTE